MEKFNITPMLEAAVALQAAAIEFSKDDSKTHCEARQAIIDMREALNESQHQLARIQAFSEYRRHGKKGFAI